MEQKYEVTIGIPVYNVEKYIRQTMDSVIAQTYESIEILICDDCGSDSSIDIIKEYQQNHPRGKDIRVLHQPKNMGIGVGRNRMMEEARGKYFYSLDGDDTIAENTIELLYNTALEYQAEIVYGSYERVFQHDNETLRTVSYAYPRKVFTSPDEYAMYVYYVGIQGMNWNYLLNLDVIRRNHLQVTPVGHGYGEDFTFTVDLPTYIDRAVLLPDITYHYYIRGVDKHHKKKVLSRKEILISLEELEKKRNRLELKEKPYYSKRLSFLMMLSCSFACEMLAKRDDFDKPFTNREIRDRIKHPMHLSEILMAPDARLHNLYYYILGKVPPFICVLLLKLLTKRHRRKKE